MRPAKVLILYQESKKDDEDRAKEVQKIVFTASQMISRAVDIEISCSPLEFRAHHVKMDETPILVVNENVIFTKHIPPVEFIKQCLMPPQEEQKYF